MDALVVRTADLAALIRPWWLRRNRLAQETAKQYGASHSRTKYGGTPGMVTTLSGDKALAHWAGTSERAVRAIANCETQWTGYYCRADGIVQALGLHQALRDGRLPLWANPFMSQQAWRAYMLEQGIAGDPWRELGVLDPWAHGYKNGLYVGNGNGNGEGAMLAQR